VLNLCFPYYTLLFGDMSSLLSWHRFWPLYFLSTFFSRLTWHMCQAFIFLSTPLSMLTCHTFLCGIDVELLFSLVTLALRWHVTLAELAQLFSSSFSQNPSSFLTWHECQNFNFLSTHLYVLMCHPILCGIVVELLFSSVPLALRWCVTLIELA
jgi:hypothetical protein